ncbi:Developmental protein SEPALLATA 3, partial [Abeliophyllum distichum]
MLRTLERYQKCNYGAPEPHVSSREALELSSQQEYLKLKARYEALQRSQRNLLGEDLGPLNSKELESLERQLDMSLKQIRSTRTQVMLDTLTDLQRREHALNEANRSLKQRLMEGTHISLQWHQDAQDVGYGREPPHQPQPDGFFHPLECEPTLQIGYQTDPMAAAAGPSINNFMSGWLP